MAGWVAVVKSRAAHMVCFQQRLPNAAEPFVLARGIYVPSLCSRACIHSGVESIFVCSAHFLQIEDSIWRNIAVTGLCLLFVVMNVRFHPLDDAFSHTLETAMLVSLLLLAILSAPQMAQLVRSCAFLCVEIVFNFASVDVSGIRHVTKNRKRSSS